MNWKLSKIFSLFCVFFQTFVMLALRGHYSIDLIAGLIIAHWCYLMSQPIDTFLTSKCKKKKLPKSSLEEPLLPASHFEYQY